jgi:hypothetical protein
MTNVLAAPGCTVVVNNKRRPAALQRKRAA